MENARLDLGGGDTSLSVRRFSVEEMMNGLTRAEITAVSEDAWLDLGSIVGHPATFSLSGAVERRIRGVCTRMELLRVAEEAASLATYALTLEPTLWRLTQRTNNRLFQHVSIPAIVTTLLDEWGVPYALRIDPSLYPAVELRVQYGESDYAFFCRLLEEAGISFWLSDEGERDATLVLGDAPQGNDPRPLPLPFVDDTTTTKPSHAAWATKVRVREESRPGRVSVRDYDPLKPRFVTVAHHTSERQEERAHERYRFEPGSSMSEGAPRLTPTPVADDLGVARSSMDPLRARARVDLEAIHAERALVTFESSGNDLPPGTVLRIAGHPRPELGKALLVTRFTMVGEVAVGRPWVFTATAALADRPHRPERRTPKPVMTGLHPAVVVGPKGIPGRGTPATETLPGAVGALHPGAAQGSAATDALTDNDIYVDEHGRVRVQIVWDREGGFDHQSSIWMRVSKGWAGGGYGLFTIPRVGHEVLVAFLAGDPDSPIIVGSVHNAAEPVPFPLPENKTVSTWKTASSPGGGGFNELRFDDARGREHVYVQAQRDMDQLVKRDLKQAVGRDRSRYVQNDEAVVIGRDRTDVVQHNQRRATGLNHASTVGLNRLSTVGVEDSTLVGARWSVTVARGLSGKLGAFLAQAFDGPIASTMRSAAASVLGRIPSDPLATTLKNALGEVGSLLQKPLSDPAGVRDGFVSDEGPAPTAIEMVDRQIKLSTGEASIILDGPNIVLEAQGNIVLHARGGTSVLADGELALSSAGRAALVSGAQEVLIQAGTDVHLNPFSARGKADKPATPGARQRRDEAAPRCPDCGEPLVQGACPRVAGLAVGPSMVDHAIDAPVGLVYDDEGETA